MSSRRNIDEQVVRDRRDPRREESIPPEKRISVEPAPLPSVEPAPGPSLVTGSSIPVPDVTALAPTSSAHPPREPAAERPSERPPARSIEVEEPRRRPELATTLGTGADRAHAAQPHVVTNADPRLEVLEPLLRAGDWNAVLRALGPAEQAGRLPPNLGLIYAVARKESEGPTDKGSQSTELAIRCTAGLLGVASDSAIALVVAKRLIRKNPVGWQQRPAPPARVSALIMIGALVIGGLVGWLVATGRLHLH
ncbi:MAG: hypothetical protein HYV09_01070 [Deltaproteobacteria bacterium]|nr:hypothetical protein [Deltaproteobacteria bacterium]